MNKKAIAILGAIFLLIMGTLGFLVYSKYYSNKTAEPIVTTGADISTSTPAGDNNGVTDTPNSSGTVVKLTDDQVISPVLFYNGSGITYFNTQGQLFMTVISQSNGQMQLTQKKMLDIPVKMGITKILWPAKGDNFLAQYNSAEGKMVWSFYNSQTGTFVDLPAQVISADWLPSSDRIVFVWSQNGKAVMEQSNPDGTNWKKIADMWEPDDSLHVSPDGQSVLYYQENNASSTNFIVQTTPDGKFWKGLVKTGYNYGVLWSPDSKKFLFGKKDLATQSTQLWYYDLTTEEVRNIGLYTAPKKAVWTADSQAFYAAVPVPGSSGGSADKFVKVDISSFSQKEYQTGSVSVDGRDLFLNLDGSKLFFKNVTDGGLYYLDLNQ